MRAPLSLPHELALGDMLITSGPRNVLAVFCASLAESDLRDLLHDLVRCAECGRTVVPGAVNVVSGENAAGDTMAFCDDTCVARYQDRSVLVLDRW